MIFFKINQECTKFTVIEKVLGWTKTKERVFTHNINEMDFWYMKYHSEKIAELIDAVKNGKDANKIMWISGHNTIKGLIAN